MVQQEGSVQFFLLLQEDFFFSQKLPEARQARGPGLQLGPIFSEI